MNINYINIHRYSTFNVNINVNKGGSPSEARLTTESILEWLICLPAFEIGKKLDSLQRRKIPQGSW